MNPSHPGPRVRALLPRSSTGTATEPGALLRLAPSRGRREHIPASTEHIRPETGRIRPKTEHIGSDVVNTCLGDKSPSLKRARTHR